MSKRVNRDSGNGTGRGDGSKVGTPARPPMISYVEVDWESLPLLYEDLARLPKGAKRVQRLRILAVQGLLFERGHRPPAPSTEAGSVGAGDVFSDPIGS